MKENNFLLSSNLFLLIVAILCGCSSATDNELVGGFPFDYQGQTYRLDCVAKESTQGFNILSKRDGNNFILKAVDEDQDGTIDRIVLGNVSIDEANEIYQNGLAVGQFRDLIKMKAFEREYITKDKLATFRLRTYMPASKIIYNELVIISNTGFSTEVVVDQNCDGKIDMVKEGLRQQDYYQKIYTDVLAKGNKEKKILVEEGKYIIEK